MEFDRPTTASAFVVLVLVGLGAAWATPMAPSTVLMMVLPALVVYGAVMLSLGIKHGEYRVEHP